MCEKIWAHTTYKTIENNVVDKNNTTLELLFYIISLNDFHIVIKWRAKMMMSIPGCIQKRCLGFWDVDHDLRFDKSCKLQWSDCHLTFTSNRTFEIMLFLIVCTRLLRKHQPPPKCWFDIRYSHSYGETQRKCRFTLRMSNDTYLLGWLGDPKWMGLTKFAILLRPNMHV